MNDGRLIDADALRYARVRVAELPVRQRDLSTVLTVPPGGLPEVLSAYLGDPVVVALAPPLGMADGDGHATTPRAKPRESIPESRLEDGSPVASEVTTE